MTLLRAMVEFGISAGASDIHLSALNVPAVRIDGQIVKLKRQAVTKEEMEQVAKECVTPKEYEVFLRTGDLDTACDLFGLARFRINMFRQANGISIAMRMIKSQIPDLASLGLDPLLSKLLTLQSGLVLVTGPAGSGKSTTIAAIIHELNKARSSHILTIEDPIEYVHSSINCMINQREIGRDSKSYATALRAALREDPDIIVVGEMRDLESISIALTAAETGHLIFSTLHTSGAAKTIDRLIDVFPPAQQQQIRIQVSISLKSVISQRLLPKIGGGRLGAFEVMYVNGAISNLIRENNTTGINNVIQTNLAEGMTTMERSVTELYSRELITKETAMKASPEFLQRLNNRL